MLVAHLLLENSGGSCGETGDILWVSKENRRGFAHYSEKHLIMRGQRAG